MQEAMYLFAMTASGYDIDLTPWLRRHAYVTPLNHRLELAGHAV